MDSDDRIYGPVSGTATERFISEFWKAARFGYCAVNADILAQSARAYGKYEWANVFAEVAHQYRHQNVLGLWDWPGLVNEAYRREGDLLGELKAAGWF